MGFDAKLMRFCIFCAELFFVLRNLKRFRRNVFEFVPRERNFLGFKNSVETFSVTFRVSYCTHFFREKTLNVRSKSVTSKFSARILVATKSLPVGDVQAHISALLKL